MKLAVTAGLLIGVLSIAVPVTSAGKAAPRGVRVLDTSGAKAVPCAPVDTTHAPFVSGGCPALINAFSTIFTVRTVFGPMRFGDCLTQFKTTFSADGRFWLDDIKIGGIAPCNDLWPCSPPSVIALRKSRLAQPPRDKVPPWQGVLLAPDGGGFKGRFGLCVDTCIGRYKGDVAVKLVRHDKGWLMRAESAGVGSSSLEIDADWALLHPPTDLDVQPGAS